MGWSYKPLWKLLIDQGMTKKQLRLAVGASSATFAKMGKGEAVSMELLDRICEVLGCGLNDIVERVSDPGE